MKQIIIIAGLILLGIAVYSLITGTLQTAASDLIGRSVENINGVSP